MSLMFGKQLKEWIRSCKRPWEPAAESIVDGWEARRVGLPEQIAELVLEAMKAIHRHNELTQRVTQLEAMVLILRQHAETTDYYLRTMGERINDSAIPLTPTQQAMADALQEIADDR